MKIALVRIHNILGIADLEVTPGQFNEITGANGVNKTNFLNAIKSVIEGGHDATLLRNGAKSGEVVLLLDDGVELRKTVTPKTSRVEVKKGETVMRRPQETIQALADLFSVNPIAFLQADKKDRAKVLLESMPIALDIARLEKVSGIKNLNFSDSMHATGRIDIVRTMVFDARTGVNRVLQEKKATIEQLRQAMPAAPGGVTSGGEPELDAQIETIQRQAEADLKDLAGKVEAWMTQKDERVAALKSEYDTAVDALKAQIVTLTTEYQEANESIRVSTAGAKQREIDRKAAINTAAQAAKQPLIDAVRALRVDRDAVAKRAQTEETIKSMAEAADHLEAESKEQTAALAAIDAYKLELLATLPIPNIEIVNGEIFRGGVPFERLNAAQRTDIAIELAKLRAGTLGCVCVDGLELLDPDAYQEFQKKALASGLQFFVTKVGRGALKINDQTFASNAPDREQGTWEESKRTVAAAPPAAKPKTDDTPPF